jgi:serine/threonine-protein kinase
MTMPALAITPRVALTGILLILVLVAAVLVLPRFTGDAGGPAAPAANTGVPATTEAPNVVGLSREQASAALERAGLTPLIFESANAAPAGEVFRQSPPVGFAVKPGDVVTLFVSQGPGTASVTPSPTPTGTPTAP